MPHVSNVPNVPPAWRLWSRSDSSVVLAFPPVRVANACVCTVVPRVLVGRGCTHHVDPGMVPHLGCVQPCVRAAVGRVVPWPRSPLALLLVLGVWSLRHVIPAPPPLLLASPPFVRLWSAVCYAPCPSLAVWSGPPCCICPSSPSSALFSVPLYCGLPPAPRDAGSVIRLPLPCVVCLLVSQCFPVVRWIAVWRHPASGA